MHRLAGLYRQFLAVARASVAASALPAGVLADALEASIMNASMRKRIYGAEDKLIQKLDAAKQQAK